jgi:putative ABC transport system substrate-binding protein
MRNAATASSSEYLMGTLRAVAGPLDLELIVAPLMVAGDIEPAFERIVRENAGGVVVMPDPITLVNRHMLIALAARHRLPAVYPFRYFADGLISYGPVPLDIASEASRRSQ